MIERMKKWYEEVKKIEKERIKRIMEIGEKVKRFIEKKERIVEIGRGRK